MPHSPRLRERARQLRGDQTEAEERLWFHLRAHRFMGLKFKRQKPMGRYILDFICYAPKLVIELDGGQHAGQVVADRERDAWLEAQGFRVLRFWNNQVLAETDAVLELIRRVVLEVEAEDPLPNPSPLRGEGL